MQTFARGQPDRIVRPSPAHSRSATSRRALVMQLPGRTPGTPRRRSGPAGPVAQVRGQPACHLDQDLVACGMAVLVVHLLEAVQIHHHHRESRAFLARARRNGASCGAAIAAVVKPGQRVAHRQPQPVLHPRAAAVALPLAAQQAAGAQRQFLGRDLQGPTASSAPRSKAIAASSPSPAGPMTQTAAWRVVWWLFSSDNSRSVAEGLRPSSCRMNTSGRPRRPRSGRHVRPEPRP
jgi:hypothetical protein